MRRYGRLFTQCMCKISTVIHELHWTMKLDIRNSGQWSLIIDYLEGWNSQVGLYSTAARPQQPSSPSLALVSTCYPLQILLCLKAKRKDKAHRRTM